MPARTSVRASARAGDAAAQAHANSRMVLPKFMMPSPRAILLRAGVCWRRVGKSMARAAPGRGRRLYPFARADAIEAVLGIISWDQKGRGAVTYLFDRR